MEMSATTVSVELRNRIMNEENEEKYLHSRTAAPHSPSSPLAKKKPFGAQHLCFSVWKRIILENIIIDNSLISPTGTLFYSFLMPANKGRKFPLPTVICSFSLLSK
jgi:hypothetical protein